MSYTFYLSTHAFSLFSAPSCGFVPKLVMNMYDIKYTVSTDIGQMMRLSRGHVNPCGGWIAVNDETGSVFNDLLSLCCDIKQTQCLPL